MALGKSVKTNVLIVGSGAAGVTAPTRRGDAGADVIVLEKEDHLGGAAAISGGVCCLVKTNLRCRVVDKHYEPISGLYAAGEPVGMAGGHINGDAGLEGTMPGPSLFSGRVAGAWAAKEAGFGAGFPDTPTRD